MQTPGTRRAVQVLHGSLAWSRGECRTGGSRLGNSWLTIGFEVSCLCDTVFTSTPKWLTFFPHLERPLNVLYSHVFERTVASIEAVSTYRRGVVDLLIIIEKSEVFFTLLQAPAGPQPSREPRLPHRLPWGRQGQPGSVRKLEQRAELRLESAALSAVGCPQKPTLLAGRREAEESVAGKAVPLVGSLLS